MGSMTGQVGLVTGASAGIGKAAALALAAEGAAVVLADLDEARGEEVAAAIRDKGGEALFLRTDVADDDQVQALVTFAVERFGGLDCASTTRASRAIRRRCTSAAGRPGTGPSPSISPVCGPACDTS
jgi:NAD(P)-dependent dehydrogenase (short-subunit alcohol dehydrogenase family)